MVSPVSVSEVQNGDCEMKYKIFTNDCGPGSVFVLWRDRGKQLGRSRVYSETKDEGTREPRQTKGACSCGSFDCRDGNFHQYRKGPQVASMTDYPLVTCLCLTMKGREKFLQRAMQCFDQQTYPNRELLIVPDTWEDIPQLEGVIRKEFVNTFNQTVTPTPQDEWRVSYAVVPFENHHSGQRRCIGGKRNLGCKWAMGEIIAVWDDDDYSGDTRIERQVAVLQATKKSVTAMDEMLFTDGSDWWRFSYREGLAAGTSLCFRRDWWEKHRFDERQYGNRGEDVRFISEAFKANQFFYTCENLMYATIHPGNTSKKTTSGRGWTHVPGFEWKD